MVLSTLLRRKGGSLLVSRSRRARRFSPARLPGILLHPEVSLLARQLTGAGDAA